MSNLETPDLRFIAIVVGAILVGMLIDRFGPSLVYSFIGFSRACDKIEVCMSAADVSSLMQGYKVTPAQYVEIDGKRVWEGGDGVEYSQPASWWKGREHACRVYIENGQVTKVMKSMFGYPDLQMGAN
jgi:hypothetical protein